MAEAIYARYGTEVREFDYTAIPRGGMIVLGMLSYGLNLPRKQLVERSPGSTLVIVDDCCYSGSRLREALVQHLDRSRIILAFLYAPDELLGEVLKKEANVVDCIRSHSIPDLMPLYEPDAELLQGWRRRAANRLVGNRYWVGLPELVIFPWTEPDTPVWNQRLQKLESGWKTQSPDRCLNNWADLGMPPHVADVEFRIPDRVIYRIVGDQVQLFNADGDDSYQLDGSASLMWRALAAYGNEAAVLDYLGRFYKVELEDLRLDLSRFLSNLLADGLVEKTTRHEG
ncbi:PqqD family peptide modification chaperone [Pseudomonadota bacterium]